MIDKICLNCHKEFSIGYKNRSKKYCSLICANHHKNNGQKQSKEKENLYLLNPRICKNCPTIIHYKKPNNKFCSWDCFQKSFEIENPEKTLYYRNCEFNFNVYNFPDEFDLSLLENYGWYSNFGYNSRKPKNLGGISKDHMISKNFGWLNKIDTYLISHPANCQLLRHVDNIRKGKKNSITLEELKERINIWNSKYN